MKRLHVHIGVTDLDQAITFYSGLFGSAPTRREADYAKWLLDDPKVNFAVSLGHEGLSHLGLQVDADGEFDTLKSDARAVSTEGVEETNAECCYAISDKLWVQDPAGVAWELFKTHGSMSSESQLSAVPRAASGVPVEGPKETPKVPGCC